MEEEQSPQQLQPVGHASPTLHIAPLSCGLRIVKSNGDNAAEDTAAAGRPRAAAGAAASAESPSECSAGAAAIFPDDAPHTNGVVSFQQHATGDNQDLRQLLSPPVAASADGRADHPFQLPLFQQQQGLEDKQQLLGSLEVHSSRAAGVGQLLESLAQAAEEVERRAHHSDAVRPRAPQPPASVQGQGTGVFTKNLDYKSCDHIMCLTKDMARHLFPQPPHTSAGAPPTLRPTFLRVQHYEGMLFIFCCQLTSSSYKLNIAARILSGLTESCIALSGAIMHFVSLSVCYSVADVCSCCSLATIEEPVMLR
jgi:hypothetical protein